MYLILFLSTGYNNGSAKYNRAPAVFVRASGNFVIIAYFMLREFLFQTEQNTWSSLIQNKRYLVVALNESVIVDDETFIDLVSGVRQSANTRKAGGQLPSNSTLR